MRARIVAPLVAAIIGITGGAVTALVMDSESAKDPETPTTIEDPLGLGIPLVELDCDPRAGILILGFGDSAPALLAAKADNPTGEPSYLETAKSCDTVYGPERQENQPTYAVFLGPFDNLIDPCELRMDPNRRGDFVTKLQSGNSDSVKCICVLPDSAARPELSLGMQQSDEDTVWVRNLQSMLVDAAERKGHEEDFPRSWLTGTYDQRTADRIAEIQDGSGVASDRGVVDDRTWGLIASRLCGIYNF